MSLINQSNYKQNSVFQNSLLSFDDAELSPLTLGSLNTASQYSFGEIMSNSYKSENDDKYQLYYKDLNIMNAQSRQKANTLAVPTQYYVKGLPQLNLRKENIRSMVSIVNKSQDLKNKLNKINSNSNSLIKIDTNKLIKQNTQYYSINQIPSPESTNSKKKISPLLNYNTKTEIKNKLGSLNHISEQTKLTVSLNNTKQYFNKKLPALQLNESSPKQLTRTISNQKIANENASKSSSNIIQNSYLSEPQLKADVTSFKISLNSPPSLLQIKLQSEKEISSSFCKCLENFPSMFKKQIESDLNLQEKMDYFRIDSIKSNKEFIEFLTKFLINFIKKFMQQQNISSSSYDQNQSNIFSSIQIKKEQLKNKVRVSCFTRQLRINISLLKEISQIVQSIFTSCEIPNSLFNSFKQLLTQEWKQQLKCQSFEEEIGGYNNLNSIVNSLVDNLQKYFEFTKAEKQKLQLNNPATLTQILKEVIEINYPSKNEKQNETRNKIQNKQQPLLKDFIKSIKEVFQIRAINTQYQNNSQFFLFKFSLWEALFNNQQDQYFPIDQKLIILQQIEKFRNQYFETEYWKESLDSPQRLNILYNIIQKRQTFLSQLGPFYAQNEQQFCEGLLQFIMGKIDNEQFINIMRQFKSDTSINNYFLNLLYTVIFDSLNVNSLTTPKVNSALLQHKFFYLNQSINKQLVLKEENICGQYQPSEEIENLSITQTMRVLLTSIIQALDKQQEKKRLKINEQQKIDKLNTLLKFLVTITFDSNIFSIFDIQEIFLLFDIQIDSQLKQYITQEFKKSLYSLKLQPHQVDLLIKYFNDAVLDNLQ